MAHKRHEKTAHEIGAPSFSFDRDNFWVKLPLGDWEAQARIEAEGGQPVVAELRVVPWARWDAEEPAKVPAGGLTARHLRTLKLGEALRAAYGQLDRLLARDVHPDSILNVGQLGFAAGKMAKPSGRAPRGDGFYARVAAAYVNALRVGSRSPVAAAAAALVGDRDQDRTYVRDLLNEARRRELLTRPPKGRAGGELTEKGRQALEEERS